MPDVSTMVVPLSALRAVALHTQGLTAPEPADRPLPSPDDIYDAIMQIGCVQIDTLYRVQRSQYLTMWSRLGQYNPADFDDLIFDPEKRRLFEYWWHAASIIPLEHYRYSVPFMEKRRKASSKWWDGWLQKPESQEMMGHVRARITEEGGLKTADFKYEGPKRGSWWDWKPSKRALEYFYNVGELMITNRENFHRVYDLRDRVLPDWVDTTPASLEEAYRFRLDRAMRAIGVCQPMQVSEYAYLQRGTSRSHIETMIEEGIFVEFEGELNDGTTAIMIVHRGNLPLLEQAADGAIQPERTTFLSPFDSLFWGAGRDEDLWGFRQILEAYKPKKDRIWGYFSLPILHHDRLVGRFDPKLERKVGVLRLEHLHLEPGVEPDAQLVTDVAAAMRDFMAFHGADELTVEHSNPPEFGEKLARAL